jgi:hypothetical protein
MKKTTIKKRATKNLPKSSSPQYWEDSRWSLDHDAEISEKYPNQWVFVFNKNVVAAGKDPNEAERIAIEKVGKQEFVIFFAEKGIHIYEN